MLEGEPALAGSPSAFFGTEGSGQRLHRGLNWLPGDLSGAFALDLQSTIIEPVSVQPPMQPGAGEYQVLGMQDDGSLTPLYPRFKNSYLHR